MLPFYRRFEAGRVNKFSHRSHVRLAHEYLSLQPFPAALARFRRELKRFAARKGQTRLYHETITVAFVRLIAARMRHGQSWRSFARANADLITDGKGALNRLYHPRTLLSAVAHSRYIAPDRN